MDTAGASRDAQTKFTQWVMWIVIIALTVFCLMRYFLRPTFWLDEAFIASSLRDPSPHSIFSTLAYGQYFPRLYLSGIALLRSIFGYHNSVLRLLPSLCFVAGTFVWARLLAQRSEVYRSLALFGAALLLGSGFWLDQAIQLKQYTFDVVLALVPFLLADSFYEETLAEGKRPLRLALLALPCCLSYTFPFALAARIGGWYFDYARRKNWRLRPSSICILLATILLGLTSIYLTDHRFNFKDSAAYFSYWHDCILKYKLQEGGALKLLAKFLWGWHSHTPLVTVGLVPLQILGVYSVIIRWWRKEESSWGARSLGSLLLLLLVIVASALLNYPICAGRAVLFTQIHTQILAIEGALFFLYRWPGRKLLFHLFVGLVICFSMFEYVQQIRAEPAENLSEVIKLLDPEISNTLWIHPCSVAQATSLPGELPIQNILLGNEEQLPPQGQRVWVLWSHMGDRFCRGRLERIRHQAKFWQTIHEDSESGLALVEF